MQVLCRAPDDVAAVEGKILRGVRGDSVRQVSLAACVAWDHSHMYLRWIWSGVAAALVTCGWASAAAQPCAAGSADLRGTVTDGGGAPVAGAAVSAGGVRGQSGADGGFMLP